jgi:hypothetical protein
MTRQIHNAATSTLTAEDRLRIRLSGDPAVARYSTARQRLVELGQFVERPWTASGYKRGVRLSNRAYAALRDFEKAANRLARSRLP